MQIWHDDLGIEDDQHEMQVKPSGLFWKSQPEHWRVFGSDASVAALGGDGYGYFELCDWFKTVELLMLAGF
jgi:hypothetical protein